MPGPRAFVSKDQGCVKQEWLSLLREGASEQCSAWGGPSGLGAWSVLSLFRELAGMSVVPDFSISLRPFLA